MKHLFLFLAMILLPAAGFAQEEVTTGFVKIRCVSYSARFYLDEFSPGIIGIRETPDAKIFHVDSVGAGRYLLAVDYEEVDGYIRGRFLFNDDWRIENNANYYYVDAFGYINSVEAIRVGDALYVTEGTPVTDVSRLEELAQTGSVRKINLNGKTNFVFAFTSMQSLFPQEQFADGEVMIVSEIGGQIVINEVNGRTKISAETWRTAFVLESAQEAPPGDDPDGGALVITPSEPSHGAQGRREGVIDLSLNVSSGAPFTLTFTLALPEGFRLNRDATALADEWTATQTLALRQEMDGIWKFEITPKAGVRASAADARKIADIAYTVDESVGAGTYEVQLRNLAYAGDGGTEIQKEAVSVRVTVGEPIGNGTVAEPVRVYVADGVLKVQSPVAEEITLYNAAGVLCLQARKEAGRTTLSLGSLPPGLYIVRGSSGWVKKIAV
jgi:hypothetical protein